MEDVHGPNPALVEQIIALLERGKSLRAICRRRGMPDRGQVYRWMRADAELEERIAAARQCGFDEYADETMEVVKREKDPGRARILFESRRWYLGKLSNAFAEKPVSIGALLNVDAGDAFAAVAGALEQAAAGIASRGHSTRRVVDASPAGPGDTAGRLARLAGPGGEGMGEDPDGR